MSAEKLIETFVQGELFISDWSPDKGANIKVIIYFIFIPVISQHTFEITVHVGTCIEETIACASYRAHSSGMH